MPADPRPGPTRAGSVPRRAVLAVGLAAGGIAVGTAIRAVLPGLFDPPSPAVTFRPVPSPSRSGDGWPLSLPSDGFPAWSRSGDVLLVAGLDGRVHALDGESGAVRWESRTAGSSGTRMRVSTDRLAVAAHTERPDGGEPSGRLYGLRRSNGRRLWQRELDRPVTCQPVLTEQDTLVFGTSSGSVHAVDMGAGTVTWRARVSDEVHAVAVLDGVVYAAHESGVAAFTADGGRRLWATPFAAGLLPGLTLTGTALVVAEPGGVTDDGQDIPGAVVALGFDGRILWSRPVAGMSDAPVAAAAGGAVLVVHYGDGMPVIAYVSAHGDERWRWPAASLLPVLAAGGRIVVQESAAVTALDPATGRVAWTQQLPGTPQEEVALAPVTASDVAYVAHGADIHALSLSDGRIMWTATHGEIVLDFLVAEDGVVYTWGPTRLSASRDGRPL